MGINGWSIYLNNTIATDKGRYEQYYKNYLKSVHACKNVIYFCFFEGTHGELAFQVGLQMTSQMNSSVKLMNYSSVNSRAIIKTALFNYDCRDLLKTR